MWWAVCVFSSFFFLTGVLHQMAEECARCGLSGATLLCGRCKRVRYCNKTCQQAHWKSGFGSHKEDCFQRCPFSRDPKKIHYCQWCARGCSREEACDFCMPCTDSRCTDPSTPLPWEGGSHCSCYCPDFDSEYA
jgi:hypothetical protein